MVTKDYQCVSMDERRGGPESRRSLHQREREKEKGNDCEGMIAGLTSTQSTKTEIEREKERSGNITQFIVRGWGLSLG